MNVSVTVLARALEPVVEARGSRYLTKAELEGWLLGASVPPLSADARSRRFILAVLRDLYANDFEVQAWLMTPRSELGGATARELMTGSRLAEVEALVVRRWNQQ